MGRRPVGEHNILPQGDAGGAVLRQAVLPALGEIRRQLVQGQDQLRSQGAALRHGKTQAAEGGGGLAQLGGEILLRRAYVDADAQDQALHPVPAQHRFAEDAAELSLLPLEVVDPLDLRGKAAAAPQGAADGHRDPGGDLPHVLRGQPGSQKIGQVEAAGGRNEAPAQPAPARALGLRQEHAAGRSPLPGPFLHPGIGGIHRLRPAEKAAPTLRQTGGQSGQTLLFSGKLRPSHPWQGACGCPKRRWRIPR